MIQEKVKHELLISGADEKPITFDLSLPKSKTETPLMIFCHGFKGFKDWGHFNWMADEFSNKGLAVLKLNFSHNGIQANNLSDLSDLEAFSMNNYSKELFDLNCIIDFVFENALKYNIDLSNIALVGHSRGGGIALLKASEDKRISKLVLWASVSEFDSFFRSETIKEWEQNGVVYAENKRTNQQLPLKKQFYDDYIKNKEKLDVKKAARLLDKPLLIIHGDADESVSFAHADTLYNLILHSILIKVEGGNHTFSSKHPFDIEIDVNSTLEELLENTFEFIIDE